MREANALCSVLDRIRQRRVEQPCLRYLKFLRRPSSHSRDQQSLEWWPPTKIPRWRAAGTRLENTRHHPRIAASQWAHDTAISSHPRPAQRLDSRATDQVIRRRSGKGTYNCRAHRRCRNAPRNPLIVYGRPPRIRHAQMTNAHRSHPYHIVSIVLGPTLTP
jgi:hypothetical protein